MILHLERLWYSERSTIGKLWAPGEGHAWTWLGFVLEDRIRAPGFKVPKATAIPAGRYEVVITPSLRFKRPLPLLLDVPMFTGIRIHAGNDQLDTEGCLLAGKERGIDRVLRSREALEEVVFFLEGALKLGKVWLEIVNVAPPKHLLERPDGPIT